MYPYLECPTACVTAQKVMAGVSMPISFIWKIYSENLLDGEADVVISCEVHSKLDVLDSGCVHNN
jgi:hypothetical protein